MLPGSREVQASGPVKEDTVIGPKIAAVERREARASVTRRAAPPKGARFSSAVPALRLPQGGNRAKARKQDRTV